MNILACTKYTYAGPSSRYRFYHYVDCFAQENITLNIAPLFSEAYFEQRSQLAKVFTVLASYLRRVMLMFGLLFFSKKYDLVLIEYELLPYFPSVFEYLFKKRHVRYIVDYDDAIFHKYDQHANSVVRRLLKDKIGKVMRHAEAVIVCNTYLQSYAVKFNANILRLPTVVLLDNYRNAMREQKQAEDTTSFVIGWIGSKSTSPYIIDILPVMERFASQYDVSFHLVGFDVTVMTEGALERCKINVIPWSEVTEIGEMLQFDVGMMPLTNDSWSKGKCGFKLVQYMSCAKPVVASPVGMNTSLVIEGENGFLAENEEEWFAAFERLYNDRALRAKMAKANLQKIETEYNHDMNCAKYIDLIRTIVKQ